MYLTKKQYKQLTKYNDQLQACQNAIDALIDLRDLTGYEWIESILGQLRTNESYIITDIDTISPQYTCDGDSCYNDLRGNVPCPKSCFIEV